MHWVWLYWVFSLHFWLELGWWELPRLDFWSSQLSLPLPKEIAIAHEPAGDKWRNPKSWDDICAAPSPWSEEETTHQASSSL
uniref:Secreted protein n=1 Tax=Picea sitchensis TaxID=3332 RepID=A0A6B9XV23_PICSI|nr:hypothetical protein Q903MT_gene6834 [Picea sitchensis]